MRLFILSPLILQRRSRSIELGTAGIEIALEDDLRGEKVEFGFATIGANALIAQK